MTISSISESTRSHRSNSTSKSSVIMSKENVTREKQREFAMSSLNRELNLGDKWYLLNKDWFQRWSAYIGLESSEKVSEIPPEKISNRRLLETDAKSIGSPAGKRFRLREDIIENTDYVTVPQELWNYLVNIYSLESDDDVIEREVIDDSVDGDSGLPNLRIEIRRLQVHMECSYNKTQPSTHIEELSRQTKIETIIEMMKRLFNVPGDKPVRLYFRSAPTQCSASCAAGSPPTAATATANNTSMTQVDVKENSTLMTTSYAPDDTIVMCVVPNDEASKPIPPAPALPASSSPQPPSYTATRYMTTRNQSFNNGSSSTSASAAAVNVERRGLCGLSNLGNTCFMNSSLQCMSNVPPLTDYFWNQTYKSEINKVNPLGRQGEIAEAYASLIADMWSGNNNYVIPRQFKLALSKFAPQFTGYQQQDSQELLAFLLDGLHEDLNRVLKKPYVELGSHVGKTDEEFAKQSWQDHLKRNDSIIVDIFHGLLKSTLNCLVCKEISIKFDPFCYLSVPLPSKKERLIEVFFVPIDPSQLLLKCKLTVLKNGTMQDLCASMESLLEKDSSILNKVPRSRMIVCDVYSNKFFKIYEPNESVTNIRERDDIYIYELQSNYSNPDFLRIKLHLREKTSSHSSSSSCFGLPLFFMVPKENLTYGSLYQLTLKYLRRFLKSTTNTSEEINSKLNNSLNVKDEESIASIDQDAEATNGGGDNSNLSEEEMSDGTTRTRLASKLAAKPFSLHVSKSDNIDYDSNFASQQNINDDTPFEWPAPVTTSSYSFNSSSSSSSQSQIVSLCADFTTASLRRNYKKSKMTVADSNLNSELVVEHSSCQTTQLSKQRKDVISLADCFSLYTKIEDLSSQDYWYCSKCKAHQASTKKFDLWKLPPVLVVHLKRFSYDRMYRDKIDTLVDFPLADLDMAPYLINKNAGNTRYNLIAVSNHFGSLGGGHYTAYGKNRCDGKWYYFDDSSVSSADETSVCTPAAYMLIYLRKDLDDMSKNGLGTLNDDTHNKSNSDRMDY